MLALVAGSMGLASLARADTLDDVMRTQTLRVAITLDYPPFGSVDTDLTPRGYDVDFARLVAQELGVKLELVRVVHASKIPTMVTRKADLLLNLGQNEERAKGGDFSQPYAPYYVGVYGPADVAVKSAADLEGHLIGVTRGTIEDQLLTRLAPPTARLQRYEDHAATIGAFISGQAQLISVGNVVAAELATRQLPRAPQEKFLLMNSPVRTAVTKGESRLLERVNAAITSIKQRGQLNELAKQWLKQPLPADF